MKHTDFRLNRKALFGMMVLAAAGAMPVQAATITVTTAADLVEADGFCSLREAVMAANSNAPVNECAAGEPGTTAADVIKLDGVTYTLTKYGLDEDSTEAFPLVLINNPDPEVGDLDITDSVSIVGTGSAATTIQWDPASLDDSRDRIFHVFDTDSTKTINVSLSGVKLAQGRTTEKDLGPGTVEGTYYRLRRGGGALAVGSAAAIVLIDPSISGTDNSLDHGGRPVEPEVKYATLAITLNDVIVDSNHADGDGGGIYNASPMTATNIVVSNNENITNGGGVYNEGNTTITDSTIRDNISEGGGGLFVTGSNTVKIERTTINANRAVGGGAISGRADVTVNVVNSTLSGNLARDVGAGFYHNGPANLRFVTIANNVSGADAPGAGSGINTFKSGSVDVQVKNVLLASNVKGWPTDVLDPPLDYYQTAPIPQPGTDAFLALQPSNCGVTGSVQEYNITSNGYNLSSDATCNVVLNQLTDILEEDPKLGPLNLVDNGGLTATHALAADSPALSAGASDAAVTTDQRGELRESPPDIGAFELDNIVEPPPPSDDDGGGCAVGGDGRFDPTLPAMLAAALAFFGLRRRAGK